MSKPTHLALVVFRKKSKGLEAKNFRKVGDYPLWFHAVQMAQNLVARGHCNEYFVSTDCNLPPWPNRDPSLCQDDSLMVDVIADALRQKPADRVLLLQPTNPLRTIDDCIRVIDEIGNSVSAITAYQDRNLSPARCYDADGQCMDQTCETSNRQDLPVIWHRCGNAYLFRRAFVEAGTLFGPNPRIVEVPKHRAFSVDDATDLEIVRALWPYREKSCLR